MRTEISMIGTRKARAQINLKEVIPGVLASSASLFLGFPHSPSERSQHAKTLWRGAPYQDSHRLSRYGHSRGWRPLSHAARASAFLHPLAPRALPRFYATMGALTPARLTEGQPFAEQVSLVHMARTSLHSVTNHPTHPAIAYLLPSQRDRLPEPGLQPASSLPCRGLANLWQTSCFCPCPGLGFTFNEQARRHVRPKRVRFTTDCKFASGCSPPRLTATQLPSAIGSGHLPREDLHLSNRACSQAHSPRRKPGSRMHRGTWIPAFVGMT
jgi:hypothetical protein